MEENNLSGMLCELRTAIVMSQGNLGSYLLAA
jgi:hypothetical protein